jgi:hypothetical protein
MFSSHCPQYSVRIEHVKLMFSSHCPQYSVRIEHVKLMFSSHCPQYSVRIEHVKLMFSLYLFTSNTSRFCLAHNDLYRTRQAHD